MFAEQIRQAAAVTPRQDLHKLSSVVWKAFAGGAITEGEAQRLAEELEALKTAPPPPPPVRRQAGSRPRSTESMARRRRWVASGLMPPQIAAHFTMGEGAVLAVFAAECRTRGRCTLTLGHVAALAGVCKTTVRNAVRQAQALGFLKSDEWRLSAFRSAPNTVTITAAEWLAWLRLGRSRGWVQNSRAHAYPSSFQAKTELGLSYGKGEGRTARSRPDGTLDPVPSQVRRC